MNEEEVNKLINTKNDELKKLIELQTTQENTKNEQENIFTKLKGLLASAEYRPPIEVEIPKQGDSEVLKEIEKVKQDFETYKSKIEKNELNIAKVQALTDVLKKEKAYEQAIDLMINKFDIDNLTIEEIKKDDFVNSASFKTLKEEKSGLFGVETIQGATPTKILDNTNENAKPVDRTAQILDFIGYNREAK